MKIVLYMHTGAGYTTASGVCFDRERPYQVVNADEVNELMLTNRFIVASKDDVRQFYGIIN